MPIPWVEDRFRLPRLGKIRLGEMTETQSGTEYPRALDHFNLKDVPWVAEALGVAACHDAGTQMPVCKELEIMFPLEDRDLFFPQALKWYRGGGNRGKKDGKTAKDGTLVCSSQDAKIAHRVRVEDKKDKQGEQFIAEQGLDVPVGGMFMMPCPGKACPVYMAKKCTEVARLLFFVPDAPKLGVYEITTGAEYTSIPAINSYIEMIRAAAGRVSMIRFKLGIEPTTVAPDGRKKTVYTLRLTCELGLQQLMNMKKEGLLAAPAPPKALPSPAELDKNFPDELFKDKPDPAPEPEEPKPNAVQAARERFGRPPEKTVEAQAEPAAEDEGFATPEEAATPTGPPETPQVPMWEG